MSYQINLCSFEFLEINGLTYLPHIDHDFSVDDPPLNSAIQPVVLEAYRLIKKSMADSITTSFFFGTSQIQNINNLLSIGTSTLDAYVGNIEGLNGRMSLLFIAKFYRLEPHNTYKVTLDLEEMPSTLMNWSGREFMSKMPIYGTSNNNILKLVSNLNQKFNLNGRIEYIPLIRRGRLDVHRFLLTSDERIIEHDFDKLVHHVKSDYQDIKIVSSPSLGHVLLLDDKQSKSEADDSYTLELMGLPLTQISNMEILILGGGDGALLYELLKRNPKHVTMVEIDDNVINACREYMKPWGSVFNKMQGPNHKVIIDDCVKQLRHFKATNQKFDIIFNDLTPKPICTGRAESHNAFDPDSSQRDNPWHFMEPILNLSLHCLEPKFGIYMTPSTGKGNVESLENFEKLLRGMSIRLDFDWRETYIPSYMEIWRFYSIKPRSLDYEKDVEPKASNCNNRPKLVLGNKSFEELLKKRRHQANVVRNASSLPKVSEL